VSGINKHGVWSLNVFLSDYHLAVAWQANKGFGIISNDSRSLSGGGRKAAREKTGFGQHKVVLGCINGAETEILLLPLTTTSMSSKPGYSREIMWKRRRSKNEYSSSQATPWPT
jgi:hypothetical protein